MFSFDNECYPTSCEVPVSVAACPCCGSAVVAEFEAWDAVTKEPEWDTVKVDCSRDGCYDEYQDSEYWRMPYVYWLPVEIAAQEWMAKEWKNQ